MSRGAALEASHKESPEERFNTLRNVLIDLLNRSHWDKDAMSQIYFDLDIKCCRMAAVCQQLMGIRQ